MHNAEKTFFMATNMLTFAENRCYDMPKKIEEAKLKYYQAMIELDDWKRKLRAVREYCNDADLRKE